MLALALSLKSSWMEGVMGITLVDGTQASPLSAGVCSHMNGDHGGSLLGIAWHFGGVPGAVSSRMLAINTQGRSAFVDGEKAILFLIVRGHSLHMQGLTFHAPSMVAEA